MSNEVVRPIDEASAKAIEQTAILGQKLTDMVTGGGRWLANVIGHLPHNLVGIADDRVAHYRARRWIEMNEDLEKDLLDRGVKDRVEPSLTVLMPLLEAAIDENRAELKDIWRRLLANAYDPSRAGRVRLSFIVLAKKLDPVDALVLRKLLDATNGHLKPNPRDYVSAALDVSSIEVMVSFGNLQELNLIWTQNQPHNALLTDKGHSFLNAVEA
jgi:hypothetical protein